MGKKGMAIICDPQMGCGLVILPEVCIDKFPVELLFCAGPRARFTPFATSVNTSTVKMVVSETNKLNVNVFLSGKSNKTYLQQPLSWHIKHSFGRVPCRWLEIKLGYRGVQDSLSLSTT